MPDGPIYRSPNELAEYLATHRDARLDAGGRVVDPNSVRARLTAEQQDRIDLIIQRESEHGAFDLEAVRELYKGAI